MGESGCGKSSLVKDASRKLGRVVWLTGTLLDKDGLPSVEAALSLRHTLADMANAAPLKVIFVLDGVEGFTATALKSTAQLLTKLAHNNNDSVKVVMTAQSESARGVMQKLVALGVPADMFASHVIVSPTQREVQAIVATNSRIHWLALRPELRALLTNLKILDWFARIVGSGVHVDAERLLGLTSLIDLFWQHWAEGGDYARSHLLMLIASMEADGFSSGVARDDLDHSEQKTLNLLARDELVRVRDERVQFTHDMMADWARLRVLLGKNWLSVDQREIKTSPKWHRAVRLYGQRLLEGTPEDRRKWHATIEALEDKTESGILVRDLFLEALFLSTSARTLLNQSWDALAANNGRLLNRLLDRFLFVATIPDERLLGIVAADFDATKYDYLLRVPYWPYWGPVIEFLHDHKEQIISLAPHVATKVCEMWLRAMPFELNGHRLRWRAEAAELTLLIAREMHTLDEMGNGYSGGSDEVVYKALLQAARDIPKDIGDLCLELAQRHDLEPATMDRVTAYYKLKAEERREREAKNPPRRFPPMLGLEGPLRAPWPEGPRKRVDHSFKDACLDSGAYQQLVLANPNAALEVLLAICIEEPQHETYTRPSLPEYGLSWWQKGEPPTYFRGPFLQFMRTAPDQGITFVVEITNFVTQRYMDDRVFGLRVTVDGQEKLWLGDAQVYRWHLDWPLSHASAMQSSLMALEQWLYEQIDQGVDIKPWVSRILRESKSLAFAGLLIEVGKKQPELFMSVLKPLLEVWEFWHWDFQLVTQHARGFGPSPFFMHNSAQFVRAAQQWHALPHRSLFLSGLMAQEFLPLEVDQPFFAELRHKWQSALGEDGEPNALKLLIERIRPENYTFELQGNKHVIKDFRWPEEIERENAEALRRVQSDMTKFTLPHNCRKIIDNDQRLTDENISGLLAMLKELEKEPREQLDRHGDTLRPVDDSIFGGICVLMLRHHEWLAAHDAELNWCRSKLEEVLRDPPPRPRFMTERNHIDDYWEGFVADTAIFLLAQNTGDQLARRLVASSMAGYYYGTTAIVMNKAFGFRDKLGDDFGRLQNLAMRWAALRAAIHGTPHTFTEEHSDLERRRHNLMTAFVDGSLPASVPDIVTLDEEAQSEIVAARVKQFPESGRRLAKKKPKVKGLRQREKVLREIMGLDERVLAASFSWLASLAQGSPCERKAWLLLIETFLGIMLDYVPKVENQENEEIGGLPNDYDSWVFELVASVLPHLTPEENPKRFWASILELGDTAHDWVERFFWSWFTNGVRAVQDKTGFFQIWSDMIEYALANPLWEPGEGYRHDLASMVFELLGFDNRWSALLQMDGTAARLTAMIPLFERAAKKWFTIPRVLHGFILLAGKPAAQGLALPGIRWIHAATQSFHDYNWRDGVQDSLVDFLADCWQHYSGTITGDPALRDMFLSLLKTLTARGSHAALSLSARVAGTSAA